MSTQEISEIEKQIEMKNRVKESIKEKMDFSTKHRGAVSEGRYIKDLNRLDREIDELNKYVKAGDNIIENKELEAEIPELTIKRDSLIEVINELEAELAELKIVRSYIENH